jgi:hypothetical protein
MREGSDVEMRERQEGEISRVKTSNGLTAFAVWPTDVSRRVQPAHQVRARSELRPSCRLKVRLELAGLIQYDLGI